MLNSRSHLSDLAVTRPTCGSLSLRYVSEVDSPLCPYLLIPGTTVGLKVKGPEQGLNCPGTSRTTVVNSPDI